jgi:signal peptidase II
MNRWVLFLCLVGIDIGTKMFALDSISPLRWGGYPFGGTPLFENFLGVSFSLNLVVNTGAAWGFFQGYPGVLFLFRIAIIAGCGVYFFFFRKEFLKTFPFILIGAGALGNSVDYLTYGHVVDFFHFVLWGYSFPIFNIADACITLGATGLILQGRKSDASSISSTK